MIDRRKQSMIPHLHGARQQRRAHGMPHVYRGRGRKSLADVYDADHAEARPSGRFRWFLSTFIAAGIGAVAIGAAIFGSLDTIDTADSSMPRMKRSNDNPVADSGPIGGASGLKWIRPKVDRLQTMGDAQAAKHLIHETTQERRDGRPYVQIKPYLRVIARLTAVPASSADLIPPFNPFKLYAAKASIDTASANGEASERTDVVVRIVELLGGILPGEDGQELDAQEVADLVARAQDAEATAIRPSFQAEGAEALIAKDAPLATPRRASATPLVVAPNTTVLAKTSVDGDDAVEDLERREQRVVRGGRGDTLTKVLMRLNADRFQVAAMVEAARPIFPESALQPGQEVHVTLVPSLTKPDRMEPARFSVFGDGHDHKVTVNRNAAGEFVASATPLDRQISRAALSDGENAQGTSLYASVYNAALTLGVEPESITQILRIHAYETDFRRRIRSGDQVEYFFDVKDEAGIDSTPGELLFTSIISGGEPQKFWRFRTPDGLVDYYDEFGNNSAKFLMRRPVRGEAVQFTSGFGMRRHPVLNFLRMHSGVDWSAPIGTPIMAAGNGVIEEAKFKGEYGNYVRIRHANGYSTSYAHQSRFAPGIAEGAKVKQGQLIGFIGTTGLSTGPHLHYEILVNNRPVDPMAIQVPRERRLTGKLLTDFQKERSRIDDLMRRTPVMTQTRP